MSWAIVLRYLPHALIATVLLAVALIVGSGLYQWGYDTANVRAEKIIGEFAKAEAKAQARVRSEERAKVEAVAKAADAYERGKEDAEKAAAGLVSGLLADKRRLHHEIGALYTERLSRDSTAPGELSEEAQRGADRLGAAVRVVAEQDAQIRGLQEAYEALRRPAP